MVLDTLSQHAATKDHIFRNSHPHAPPTTTLDTILMKVFFLVCLSAAYFDPEDPEIYKFALLARSDNLLLSYYPQTLWMVGLTGLFRCIFTVSHPIQAWILLLIEELHTSVTGAYFGTRKLTYYLFAYSQNCMILLANSLLLVISTRKP